MQRVQRVQRLQKSAKRHVTLFQQLLNWWDTCLLGCRLKDYLWVASVWMNDFCPYFAWLGSIIMCLLINREIIFWLNWPLKGGFSTLPGYRKIKKENKDKNPKNSESKNCFVVVGCFFRSCEVVLVILNCCLESRRLESFVCEQRNYCPPRYITLH